MTLAEPAICASPDLASNPNLDSERISRATNPRFFDACQRLALAELPTLRLRALLEAANFDPERALSDDAVADRARLPVAQLSRLQRARDVSVAATGESVFVLLRGATGFPSEFVARDDPGLPPLLFVRGEISAIDLPGVAIVGTRRPSPYGIGQAQRFARAMGASKLALFSGGAAGIDTVAHTTALEAGSPTVAVIACGVDIAYPSGNRALFDRIVDAGGAIVSEYAPGSRPEPWRFPARNRLIAGLSRATLVVEAPENSGSLITARFAGEFGRDVFVVPGPVDAGRFFGSHQLIRDGAVLVSSPEEMLFELGRQLAMEFDSLASPPPRVSEIAHPAPPIVALPDVGTDERLVYDVLSSDPVLLDRLADLVELSAPRIAVAMTLLEMRGLAISGTGGFRR